MAHAINVPQIEAETHGHEAYLVSLAALDHPQHGPANDSTIAKAAGCEVHPGLCVETEPGHYDHHNHGNYVADKRGARLVDVSFVQLSEATHGAGPSLFGIGGMGSEDYPADEFHAASANVRRLMDAGDEMAEKTMLREGDGPTALARIDQKIEAELARLVALVAHRRRVAISLNPPRTLDAMGSYVDLSCDEAGGR